MLRIFALLSLLSFFAIAAPVLDELHAFAERQTAGCPRYTIINTRGTGEPQGESSGFTTMNRRVRAAKSGGTIYNTVYSAGFSQNSALATRDIINKITTTLRSDPGHCFILEGYSQGAAATTNALPDITGASFNAVKGVFMIGNPNHKAGLACNVDTNGGTSTLNVNGISARLSQGIPANWVDKTLDVCNFVSLHLGVVQLMLTYRVMEFAILPTERESMPPTSPTLETPELRTSERRSSPPLSTTMGQEAEVDQLPLPPAGKCKYVSNIRLYQSHADNDRCECRYTFFCPCRYRQSTA
jgi:hypothetical protein